MVTNEHKLTDEKQLGIDSLVLKEEKGLRFKNLAKALPIAVLGTCIAYGVYNLVELYPNNHKAEQVSASQIVQEYHIQKDRY